MEQALLKINFKPLKIKNSFLLLNNLDINCRKSFHCSFFSKDTLLPFFTGSLQLLIWKKIFSLLLSSVMKP